MRKHLCPKNHRYLSSLKAVTCAVGYCMLILLASVLEANVF